VFGADECSLAVLNRRSDLLHEGGSWLQSFDPVEVDACKTQRTHNRNNDQSNHSRILYFGDSEGRVRFPDPWYAKPGTIPQLSDCMIASKDWARNLFSRSPNETWLGARDTLAATAPLRFTTYSPKEGAAMETLPDEGQFLPGAFPLGSWNGFEPVDKAVLMFVQDANSLLLIHKRRGLGAGKVNAPG